ncbi:MAG: hypothetical protein WA563_00805 [Candidatus Acidiferrales bacterium]
MDLGIQFSVSWEDQDIIEVRVSVWNGTFGGTAYIYTGNRELDDAAAKLSRFPKNISDDREIFLGTFDPKYAGGGVRMRFYCTDHSGHAYVDSQIQSDPRLHTSAPRTPTVQSSLVSLPIEAAAVDTFVDELRRMAINRSGAARLAGVRPHDR